MKNRNFKYSDNWKQWLTTVTIRTCLFCAENNGKIFHVREMINKIPAHTNCRCIFVKLLAISAGEATDDGKNGADWYLKYLGKLPDHYITKKEAKNLGWKPILGNLSEVAPDCMIFGGKYKNRRGFLPQKEGRIWYEADINYTGGWRNTERVLFSSDGLIFVTYDHYRTFVEVVQ